MNQPSITQRIYVEGLTKSQRKEILNPQVLKLRGQGMTIREIWIETAIPTSTIGKWVKDFGKVVKVKKRVVKPTEVTPNQQFVLDNGSTMTNAEIYSALGLKTTIGAGLISGMKRTKMIGNDFLLDDQPKPPKSKKVATPKVVKSKEDKLKAYFKKHKNAVELLQKRVKYKTIEELCGISYWTVLGIKDKMAENRTLFQAYQNGGSEIKDLCRSIVIDHMMGRGALIGNMLVMPSNNCIFERRVIDEISQYMTFDAVELDTKVFSNMVTEFGRLNIMDRVHGLYNCKVGEVVAKANTDEYAHAFLDYCGVFSTYENDVKTAMNNKIVKRNGVLAFTFCLARDRGSAFENLNNRDVEGESKTLTGIKTYFNENLGETYAEKEMFQYKSDNGVPMLLVVLKRIK